MSQNVSQKNREHGDFSGLANNYSKFRPGYSQTVLDELMGLMGQPPEKLKFADVGAGTGIWTRMLANTGCQNLVAVEPNDDMRSHGKNDSKDLPIVWQNGDGEKTNLADSSVDLLTMASSFHWVKFEKGVKEFNRVLLPGGRFVALWNPRLIQVNPMLIEIEDTLYKMAPNIKRVSSGRAAFTENLMTNLKQCGYFKDVLYLEGKHVEKQTPEQYLGVWWSVNDIQVQAGKEIFGNFMEYVTKRVQNLEYIDATYQTRAWTAVKND